MLQPEELFTVAGYSTRVLSQEDIPQIQAFYEACADYSLLVDGYLPRPGAAVSLLTDCPPEKSVDDKYLFGIYLTSNTLVGVLDVIRDYPEQNAWWIGLLLFHPAHRNNRLGTQTIGAFEEWALQMGAKWILLGVIEANVQAFKFWRALGYNEINRQPPMQIGNLTHVIITMAHELSGVDSA